MPFRTPDLPTLANVWHGYDADLHGLPPNRQPDLLVSCQLRMPKPPPQFDPVNRRPLMLLLLPKRTDVRPLTPATGPPDIVEVPHDSGRFYFVVSVDDVARDFPNEYRLATIASEANVLGGLTIPIP